MKPLIILITIIILITNTCQATQPTISWHVGFEFDNKNYKINEPFTFKLGIASESPVDEGIIEFLPLERGTDAETDSIIFTENNIPYQLTDKLDPKISKVSYAKEFTVSAIISEPGRFRVKVLVYADEKLRTIETIYIEAQNGTVYCGSSDFTNKDYNNYLAKLTPAEKTSKKALRTNMESLRNVNSAAKGDAVIMPIFATVKEAVEATGGTYNVISDDKSAGSAVDNIFKGGLTASDDPKGRVIYGPADVRAL